MSARRAGWRVALRLARREALRRRGQTALMLVLVCLPVIAVTAAAIVWRTADVSSAESVTRRMGAAQAHVVAGGSAVVLQLPDPEDGSYAEGQPRAISERDIDASIGRRPLVPYLESSARFVTARGQADTSVVSTDLADPLTRGLFELRSGRYPRAADEVLVNRVVADRGNDVGSTLTVVTQGVDGTSEHTLRIVGVADSAKTRKGDVIAVAPGALGPPQVAPDGVPVDNLGWLIGGGPVTWDDVRALNAVGLLVDSRSVLRDPPPESVLPPEVREGRDVISQVVVTTLVLVITMVLLEVVLLAGPAFAVRARAQARTLALVAATGGTPAQARRTVLASGVVVGVLGGGVGVLLGIGVGALALPVAQSTSYATFGPFEVPWPLLGVVAGFGLVSAVLAALMPAISAGRQDVVAVLGGRRGETRTSRRSPVVGLALLGGGVGCGVLGSQPGQVSPPLMGACAVLSVLGMIGLVGIAVAGVARLGLRLPLSLRFAARDAARNRTRTVPAIAAVAATVAGAATLGIGLSTTQAAERRDYSPQLSDGWAAVTFDAADGPDQVQAILDRVLGSGRARPVETVASADPAMVASLDFARSRDDMLYGASYDAFGGTAIAADEMPDGLGISDEQRRDADAALARGEAVYLVPARDQGQDGPVPTELPDGVVTSTAYPAAAGGRGEETSVDVPIHTVTLPLKITPAQSVVPTSLVERLGLVGRVQGYSIPPGVSSAEQKEIDERLAGLAVPATLYVERGYQPDDAARIVRWVMVLLSGVLMLGGTLTATFLALSDARPDLATMTAVGARPRTRRRVAGAYALLVGSLGAVLGAAVGFVPGLAISRSLGHDRATGDSLYAVPWSEFAVVVLGLPLLTAVVVALCARARLPLVARID